MEEKIKLTYEEIDAILTNGKLALDYIMTQIPAVRFERISPDDRLDFYLMDNKGVVHGTLKSIIAKRKTRTLRSKMGWVRVDWAPTSGHAKAFSSHRRFRYDALDGADNSAEFIGMLLEIIGELNL